MSASDVTSLIIQGLFGLIFLRAITTYAARRDPVSRDVALIFSPFVALFTASFWETFTGATLGPVALVAVILLLLQPLFALHLVSLIRPVPRPARIGSTVLIIGGMVVAILIQPAPPVVGVVLIGTFIGTEMLAAGYLVLEARRRIGPGSRRLWTAALSTVLFAAALVSSWLTSIGPAAVDVATAVSQTLAFLAAVGYLVAFMPPASVRNIWMAGETVRYQKALLGRSGASVAEIWQGFVDFAAEITGDRAVLVMQGADMTRPVALAAAGVARPDDLRDVGSSDTAGGDHAIGRAMPLDALPVGSLARTLGEIAQARFVSAVPLTSTSDDHRLTLFTMTSGRSLFHETDLELFATIGAQTAVVAERRAVLSEQQALATRLSELVEALKTASQAKSEFLASMSHELRTPLSAILGFSDLMRQEPASDGQVSVPLEWVDHIHRGGEHLLVLINDVLDLAKIEAGRLDLKPEPIELEATIDELVNSVRPLADRKQLRLTADVHAMSLIADRSRIRQVLYNLLSNAIKFTPDGGRIGVEAREDDGSIVLTVSDTGVGIAPADLQAVFEEFRQVGSEEDRAAGTGLGLALSRRLVEAHGGTIDVTSVLGEGSRFTVRLPRVDLGTTVARALDRPSVTATPSTSPEVLVIEDDPSAVRLLRDYLEPAGYQVRVAADGERGLKMARESRPAAIVLDVLLPAIDGWEVLRRLKADPALVDVPVVIATVIDEQEVGFALGAADYIVKPIHRATMLASLARFAPVSPAAETPVILAVDDEPAALTLVQAALAGQGYEVVTARGGQEALDVVRARSVDVVVCDLLMPDVDGFQVVQQLKDDPSTSHIPILICTAHDLDDAERQRLHGQVLGVVAKGGDARTGLRDWLARVVPRTVPSAPAA